MNEPETYKRIYDGGVIGYGNNKSDLAIKNIPLYTAEQLHPRVKMTQSEFDEWKEVFDDYEFFSDAFSQGVTVERHTKLFKKLYLTKHDDLSSLEIEVKFATLWANYNPDNPEETIEIIPSMKWFVRSKERNSEKNYYYFVGKRPTDYWQLYGYKMAAKQFDTKEEAEKWTNPLTEAVQLPVEEKKQ